MLLRPSTPLSVLLFAAFALLLIAVISTPVVAGIKLGEVDGVSFGVLGFCRSDGCSPAGIGYEDGIFDSLNADFDMPNSIKGTLSSILVVHPVAALITLVLFGMAVASHFHAASHSSKYLLAMFILLIVDFLLCILCFVIDLILFMPHMTFGTYLVLAAAIIVLISGVVSCMMRRSVMGRKARRKRIAENAEMSGENYYNREGNDKTFDINPPSIPMTSGANTTVITTSGNDNLPAFASFENSKTEEVSDDRMPLTRTRSPPTASSPPPMNMNDMSNPADAAMMNLPPHRSGSRDPYDSHMNGPADGYGVARGPSMESMRSRGSSYRGRGGHYGRGGPDMYAGARGRGGYGGPGRGGYGPPRGRGGLGPPPRGHHNMRGRPPPHGYNNMGQQPRGPPTPEVYGAYGRRPSDGYNNGPGANPTMTTANDGYEPYNPDMSNANLARAESPPPMITNERAPSRGGPVEMDAANNHQVYGDYPNIRDSDTDVAGMVGLQQQPRSPDGRHDTYMSEGSKYSNEDQYAPPRAQWNQDGRNSPLRTGSPLNHAARDPAELGGRNSPHVARGNAGQYYEDVDPRFTQPSPVNVQPPPIEPVYEDVHATMGGARSPTESERSNFTSVSQRGVNPRWNPPPPMPHYRGSPSRQGHNQGQQRQDMILDNPDFQIPGGSSRGPTRRGGGGMIPGSAYPTNL